MASDVLTDFLVPFLVHSDTLGSIGSLAFPRRANLLVQVTERHFHEDEIALKIHRKVPEGWGIEQFFHDHMDMPKDVWLPETEWLIWDAQVSLPPLHQTCWILGVFDQDFFRGNLEHAFVADDKTSVIPLHEHVGSHTSIRLLELYAGGFGGWKSALSLMRHFGITTQVVAIEASLEASVAYALSHHATWVGPQTPVEPNLFVSSKDDWILQKDVHDPEIKSAIGQWAPNMITISAPCPPWSSAAYSAGISDRQGQLFSNQFLNVGGIALLAS